ncbi:hypothetical protein G8C92_05770 [Paenibacillus donghaensis]|uniref:hypothetical protein n=1 Tax=Paenibacillus donghaensis TaxID=414771 RepID=UPI00188415EC|nr:hypothetical protein [Paenibacillus donghaensis]MBE9913536.1 hypothetical protein [Paenibacillus donghaensis]
MNVAIRVKQKNYNSAVFSEEIVQVMEKFAKVQEFRVLNSFFEENKVNRCIFAGVFRLSRNIREKGCTFATFLQNKYETYKSPSCFLSESGRAELCYLCETKHL